MKSKPLRVASARHCAASRATHTSSATEILCAPLDMALVCLLSERFKITQAVGVYKAETGLPPADPGREEAQIARLKEIAVQADLDPEFTEKFLRFIIDEVIRHHEKARAAA
ncbi:chorismate mutase [archaeon]|nr:MAG: chorismate mutase [archaeon]